MGLLQTLCLVKTDTTDSKSPNTNDTTKANANPNGNPNSKAKANPEAARASCEGAASSPASQSPDQCKYNETEMEEFSALLPEHSGIAGSKAGEDGAVRQRVI